MDRRQFLATVGAGGTGLAAGMGAFGSLVFGSPRDLPAQRSPVLLRRARARCAVACW